MIQKTQDKMTNNEIDFEINRLKILVNILQQKLNVVASFLELMKLIVSKTYHQQIDNMILEIRK